MRREIIVMGTAILITFLIIGLIANRCKTCCQGPPCNSTLVGGNNVSE